MPYIPNTPLAETGADNPRPGEPGELLRLRYQTPGKQRPRVRSRPRRNAVAVWHEGVHDNHFYELMEAPLEDYDDFYDDDPTDARVQQLVHAYSQKLPMTGVQRPWVCDVYLRLHGTMEVDTEDDTFRGYMHAILAQCLRNYEMRNTRLYRLLYYYMATAADMDASSEKADSGPLLLLMRSFAPFREWLPANMVLDANEMAEKVVQFCEEQVENAPQHVMNGEELSPNALCVMGMLLMQITKDNNAHEQAIDNVVWNEVRHAAHTMWSIMCGATTGRVPMEHAAWMAFMDTNDATLADMYNMAKNWQYPLNDAYPYPDKTVIAAILVGDEPARPEPAPLPERRRRPKKQRPAPAANVRRAAGRLRGMRLRV